MLLYPLYKAIKQHLNGLGIQTFFYIKQYEPNKENTSYKVPAIYIEMPNYRGVSINYYGKKLKSAKDCVIKIHYISYAPFKNHTNTIQDNLLQEHSNVLKAIDLLMDGYRAKDPANNELSEAMMNIETSELNFMANCVVSVITYRCEAYLRHLQG
ncbi:MAG: hypothetical protein NTZ59_11635 [Bacteroidetes bacterium]|nr:hypothetical protein [Bacteroidota bacterium]